MAAFDLTKEKPGAWFDYEEGRVQLRIITTEIYREIKKKTVKKRIVYKTVDGKPSRFEYEEEDEDQRSQLFWDYNIVDWENFFDISGKPIPCTAENKMLLLSRVPRFLDFVNKSLDQLRKDEEFYAEEEEKN
jgi:hypothetical protein